MPIQQDEPHIRCLLRLIGCKVIYGRLLSFLEIYNGTLGSSPGDLIASSGLRFNLR